MFEYPWKYNNIIEVPKQYPEAWIQTYIYFFVIILRYIKLQLYLMANKVINIPKERYLLVRVQYIIYYNIKYKIRSLKCASTKIQKLKSHDKIWLKCRCAICFCCITQQKNTLIVSCMESIKFGILKSKNIRTRVCDICVDWYK